MNLFEVVAILLIGLGLVVGFAGAVGQGAGPAFVGALTGAAKGFGFYLVLMLSILVTLSLGLLYRPSFPRCRNGRCSARHYRYLSLDGDSSAEFPLGDLLARCACGTLYSRSNRDRRVSEVLADGSHVPYMYHRPLGRWRPDHRRVGAAS